MSPKKLQVVGTLRYCTFLVWIAPLLPLFTVLTVPSVMQSQKSSKTIAFYTLHSTELSKLVLGGPQSPGVYHHFFWKALYNASSARNQFIQHNTSMQLAGTNHDQLKKDEDWTHDLKIHNLTNFKQEFEVTSLNSSLLFSSSLLQRRNLKTNSKPAMENYKYFTHLLLEPTKYITYHKEAPQSSQQCISELPGKFKMHQCPKSKCWWMKPISRTECNIIFNVSFTCSTCQDIGG